VAAGELVRRHLFGERGWRVITTPCWNRLPHHVRVVQISGESCSLKDKRQSRPGEDEGLVKLDASVGSVYSDQKVKN
jgi:hypothetical protein